MSIAMLVMSSVVSRVVATVAMSAVAMSAVVHRVVRVSAAVIVSMSCAADHHDVSMSAVSSGSLHHHGTMTTTVATAVTTVTMTTAMAATATTTTTSSTKNDRVAVRLRQADIDQHREDHQADRNSKIRGTHCARE